MLSNFNIDNETVEIEVEQLDELPLPFFALLKDETDIDNLVLVTKIESNQVYYFNGVYNSILREHFTTKFNK